MLKNLSMIFIFMFTISFISNPAFAQSEIPSWIKNNAGWWAEGAIDDKSFVQGIKFLVGEGLLSSDTIPNNFPPHLKTASADWANDKISDDEYLLTLESWIVSESKSTTVESNQPKSIQQKVPISSKLPGWVKNIFVWYANDQVSENEVLNSIKYMVQEKIVVVEDSNIEKITCDTLYNEAINLIVSYSVFLKIADGILEIGILYPELLPDEELTESVWSETGKIVTENPKRIQDITEKMDSKRCNLTKDQSNMMKFLEGYLNN